MASEHSAPHKSRRQKESPSKRTKKGTRATQPKAGQPSRKNILGKDSQVKTTKADPQKTRNTIPGSGLFPNGLDRLAGIIFSIGHCLLFTQSLAFA